MAQIDATVVNVSLANLAAELHAGLSAIQWVMSGYLLALALMLAEWMAGRSGRGQGGLSWVFRGLYRDVEAARAGMIGAVADRLRRGCPGGCRLWTVRGRRHAPAMRSDRECGDAVRDRVRRRYFSPAEAATGWR